MTLWFCGIALNSRTLWKQKWTLLAGFFSLYLSLFVVLVVFQAVNKAPRRVRYVQLPPHAATPTTRIPPALLGHNLTRLYRTQPKRLRKTWREPFKMPDFKFSRRELRLQFKEVSFVDPDNPYYDNTDRFHCTQSHLDRKQANITEDLWCQPRPKYLDRYKNPCFNVEPNRWFPYGGTACIPHFHILGADKCGTTDFHSRLTEHPRILLNNGGLGKETYYWCWLRYGIWMMTNKRKRSFEDYLILFYKPSIRLITELRRSNQQMITGDGTPMDLWDFRGWQLEPQNEGLDEPKVLTPHLMRHMYKDPRFFVLMRNPVERLFSDYIFLGYGFTPEKFAEDVPKAITLMRDCLKVNTTRSCFFSDEMYHKLPMRLHIGCYSIFLREWLSVFHRRHFFFLRTEDYHANTTQALEQSFEFLGVGFYISDILFNSMGSITQYELPSRRFGTNILTRTFAALGRILNVSNSLTAEELKIMVSAKNKHVTFKKTQVGKMYPETRALLVEFYTPFNQDLAKLMGDELYLWQDNTQTHSGVDSTKKELNSIG